jgi:hypothetical protein
MDDLDNRTPAVVERERASARWHLRYKLIEAQDLPRH